MTLLLSRSDLSQLLDVNSCLKALRDGFTAVPPVIDAQRVSTALRTLADVLRGTVPGRTSDEETTIYTPVGLPWQDLALAWTAYQQALRAGSGRRFDFLA